MDLPSFSRILYVESNLRLPYVNTATLLKSLVIVDDEVAYLNFLSDMMTAHLNCPVATFSRPLAALEALKTVKAGAIVTDYYMPQMVGTEFIQRLRPLAPGIPVIVITGHGPELEGTDLSAYPEIRAVVHKPFHWQRLADMIVRQWDGFPAPEIRMPGAF